MNWLDVRDRHLTTQIVYGTLRWQAMLDFMLSSLCSRPWDEVDPGARILLRMSLFQLWQMDRVPEYAVVHDAVELAKKDLGKGIDGFVNGVLRRLTRTHPWKRKGVHPGAPPWTQVSLPKWLWERWAARHGEAEAMEYALSLNANPQMAVRQEGDLQEKGKWVTGFVESELVPGAYIRDGNGEIPAMDIRTLHFQDEASQLIPHLLHLAPGSKIWDACAAPGGKTAILSRLCGPSGRVVSSDLRKERVRKMREALAVAGMGNMDVVVTDASGPSPFVCGFDAVLADVPCSGMGTLRRNPEIKWNFMPQDFAGLEEIQAKILHQVSHSVRIGGRLLYSTCSTEPEENENIVRLFLSSHSGFSLTIPDYPQGIERWIGADGMVRTFPSPRLWDGFFAALMTRRS